MYKYPLLIFFSSFFQPIATLNCSRRHGSRRPFTRPGAARALQACGAGAEPCLPTQPPARKEPKPPPPDNHPEAAAAGGNDPSAFRLAARWGPALLQHPSFSAVS